MSTDLETNLILIAAVGVLIFLFWVSKHQISKIMWSCFGGFILTLIILKNAKPFISAPYVDTFKYILFFIMAGFFIAGVALAWVVSVFDEEIEDVDDE